jgi:hypothetical protein
MSLFRVTGPFVEHAGVSAAIAVLSEMRELGAVPPAYFLPEQGTTFESWSFAYGTKLAKEMTVVQTPRRGKLRGTLCVAADAMAVVVRMRDGVLMQEAIGDVADVVRIPVELSTTLSPIILEIVPEGSHVPIYPEGHTYRIHFQCPESTDMGHTVPFDLERACDTARAYREAHPEVRWADVDADPTSAQAKREREDLMRSGLSPVPWPRSDLAGLRGVAESG